MNRGGRALAALLLAALTACAPPPGSGTSPSPAPNSASSASPQATPASTIGSSPAHPTRSGTAPRTSTPHDAELRASFARLEAGLGARVGLAYAQVGSHEVAALGSLRTGVAWSTAKVPVSLAVLADDPTPSPGTRELIRRALRESDNAAAEALFSRLGTSGVAAAKTTAILRSAGVAAVVPAKRLRAGFTIPGQMQWSLAEQAEFAARLGCLDQTGVVADDLAHIAASQSWGLGRLPAARFKGGWGPDGDGYLVRQLGVVVLDGGPIAIAIIARAGDGSLDSGVAAVNRVADWAKDNVGGRPVAACPLR